MSEPILVTRALTKKYGGARRWRAWTSISKKGRSTAWWGRNGAGKTTIIRMLTAQTVPTSGEIELFGETGEKGISAARARVGAMVEIPSFYPYLTARENLEYYRRQRGIPGEACVDRALEQVGLHDAGKKKFKQFSLGMKQRLGLALALMNHPDLLLLDEPINGLDPEGIVEFRSILLELNRQRETTILISSHILSELSNIATHYGFLDQGRMLEQVSAGRLSEKCRACLQLTVDDASRAALVLEQRLGTRDYEVLPGNILRLYHFLDCPQDVTAALVEAGVALFSAENKNTTLEDYFLSLIGGVRHG